MTQIVAKYVNPPKDGGKQSTVKTPDGTIYGFWPDKVQMVQGKTYEVEVSTREYQGKTYRTVEKASEVGGGNGEDREQSIFITGVVGRAMQSGKFDISDISSLAVAAREAWRSVHEDKLDSPKSEEIPY